MDIETLLAETFAAHEHLAPDEDHVLEAAQRRIRHARLVHGRSLAVAASVAVVAGAAGGAEALSHHPDGVTARHAQATAGRTGPPSGQQRESIAPLTMPFDLGWLPTGSVRALASRINVGAASARGAPSFDGEYLLTVTTSGTTFDIDVQQFPGALADVAFKSGPGTPVTIGGRPGIESTSSGGPGGYELYFQDTSGGLMYVNVAAPAGHTSPAGLLSAIGRRVAENVTFPGSTQVTPEFGIGSLPAGLRVRAFDVETAATGVALDGRRGHALRADGATAPTTSYDIGTGATLASDANVYTSAGIPRNGTAGRFVQGHETRYTDDRGYLTLLVLDAVHGDAVAIASGKLPLAELYEIADGLRLPR